MNGTLPEEARRSAWHHAAAVLFGLAILSFAVLWSRPSSSGIGQLIARSSAVSSFGALWLLGALSFVIGILRAWRKRWRPLIPALPALLGVLGLLGCGWFVLGRATPERLVLAAARGDVAWVERCLGRGVGVDERYEVMLGFGGSQRSATALGAAAGAGRLEVVQILLASGADLEATDSASRTPCAAAVAGGHVDVVARLLEAGSNLPALSLALSSQGDRSDYPMEAMLRLLVRGGADPTPWPLHHQALWLTDAAAGRTLAAASDAAETGPGPWSRLLQALGRGDASEAIRLHEEVRGAAAGAGSEAGLDDVELLHLGAGLGQEAFVRHLLAQGLPVDAAIVRQGAALTALHHAVVRGHTGTVELLVESGADIERRDAAWGTALHRACFSGRAEVGAYLIRAGADLEAPRSEALPGPPLFSCVASGSVPLARLLLEAGADPTVRDELGRTAADEAERRGRAELAQLLRTWTPR